MKVFFKFIIGKILADKAHKFLKKNKIQVIAVTGSVGKTSTKEAIYTVLKSKFKVAASQKSFNTPIGLSLAVLGQEESGFSSVKAWLKILKNVFTQTRPIPQKMVLEMGADSPGDIGKLIKIAPPYIGVVTAVQEVHLAEGQFKNIEDIAQEKGTLIRFLPKNGWAFLNADDIRVKDMPTPAQKILYGQDSNADLVVKDIDITPKDLKFNVIHKEQTQRFSVPVVGKFQIYVCLPAIAIGLTLGMTLEECADALKSFKLPPGRMNPIVGLKGASILDGSYNASPATMSAALTMLSNFVAARKIVALGTMNELGAKSQEAHLKIGEEASKVAHLLILVGKEAETLKKGALKGGMKEKKIHTFLSSKQAGIFLRDQLEEGDLVLVKGSQNQVRMELLVKEIMADPSLASQLLCRQGTGWAEV